MEKIKTIAYGLVNEKALYKAGLFTLFLAIALLAPLAKNQYVTGPIVNALLFISTSVLGIWGGILIGFLPSMASGVMGLLPVPLLPMIPYIIISNIILVVVFGRLKNNFWLAVFTASALKFLFLFLSSSFVISFFIQKSLPPKIISMMTWPQLTTALLGGILAYFLSSFVNLFSAKKQ